LEHYTQIKLPLGSATARMQAATAPSLRLAATPDICVATHIERRNSCAKVRGRCDEARIVDE
jgi:hypothetical protein